MKGFFYEIGLPSEFTENYTKLNKNEPITLFEWQEQVLSDGKSRYSVPVPVFLFLENILNGKRNLLYAAPTSAGKTLVSEILVAKCVARGHKAILIFPFVALG